MVRPLLTALLTVAAVAWPAAALGPVPSPSDTAADPFAATSTVADPAFDLLDPVTLAAASTACRVVKFTQDPSDGPLPDVGLSLDPDSCIRGPINDLVEEVWPWIDLPIELKVLDTFILGGLAVESASSLPV